MAPSVAFLGVFFIMAMAFGALQIAIAIMTTSDRVNVKPTSNFVWYAGMACGIASIVLAFLGR